MDSHITNSYAELPSVETPEDVAVLYSWANLHGAKYRDFSASRREYRAQLRHRAAEQARESELHAQEGAEQAAVEATKLAQEAEAEVAHLTSQSEEGARQQAQHEADVASERAALERLEAARCAAASAHAATVARREEREIAEAHAAAQHQEALYEEQRNRPPTHEEERRAELPGTVSDPYTPESRQPLPASEVPQLELLTQRSPGEQAAQPPIPVVTSESVPAELRRPVPNEASARPLAPTTTPMRRPQGYQPDDASGVRQIYNPDRVPGGPRQGTERITPSALRPVPEQPAVPVYATRETTLPQLDSMNAPQLPAQSRTQPTPQPAAKRSEHGIAATRSEQGAVHQPAPARTPTPASSAEPVGAGVAGPATEPVKQPYFPERRRASSNSIASTEPAGDTADPVPRRRRQDQPGYRVTDSDRAIAAYRRSQSQAHANAVVPAAGLPPAPASPPKPQPRNEVVAPEPVLPAWIHDTSAAPAVSQPGREGAPARSAEPQQPETGTDTLQRSRERVASRWFALKGVFGQPGAEPAEAPPARQREMRTPVLAVFSFAGGVGKTSLVATLGRSLSSLGEKVLLTDTTSHGLLPFYFGASELRESTVRTFSPPSGSTDAPIYLVNHPIDQPLSDAAEQGAVVDRIVENGRGTHRIVLDLTSSTAWLLRRIAHLSPTILVPLAPDMNSVISLQSIERFFRGIDGPDGTPIKVFFVINQFDAGQPLHLDVREVLRRQLGERLLPLVIRRAPAVSEALAEGMTIIDYAADAPVAEDYLNVAHWLRSVAAPAAAGFRNVRWSER